MSLDVNKIIMESIQSVTESEKVKEVGEAAKEKIKDAIEATKDVGEEAKEKIKDAVEATKDVGGEAKDKAVDAGKTLINKIKDNPELFTAGTAAALAAGIGAVALRKRLAKAAKK